MVFWVGLILFALALLALFGIVWVAIFLPYPPFYIEYVKSMFPPIVGGVVFAVIGIVMMRSETRNTGGRVGKMRKWWKQKWYWVVCMLLPLILTPVLNYFVFAEVPIGKSLIYAVILSFGVFLAYIARFGRLGKKQFEVRTLRRIVFISFGAFVLGSLSWAFIVTPLASRFNIPVAIVLLLLLILMAIGALVMDTIMKRRDYRPFMEGTGQ